MAAEGLCLDRSAGHIFGDDQCGYALLFGAEFYRLLCQYVAQTFVS